MENSEQICVYNGMEWLEGGLALCSFQGSREPLGLRPSHDELMRITNILLEPHIWNTCVFLDMVWLEFFYPCDKQKMLLWTEGRTDQMFNED